MTPLLATHLAAMGLGALAIYLCAQLLKRRGEIEGASPAWGQVEEEDTTTTPLPRPPARSITPDTTPSPGWPYGIPVVADSAMPPHLVLVTTPDTLDRTRSVSPDPHPYRPSSEPPTPEPPTPA